LKDLRLLIQSRYPLLYVESYDEERLEQRLVRVCRELRIPFFTWSVSQGLHGEDTYSLDETRQPVKLLEQIRAQRGPALYLLRDFHPYLSEPALVRALREVAQESGHLVTLVLCSPAIELPMELRKLAARYRLQLPTPEELRECVLETFKRLKHGRTLRFGLDQAQLGQLVHSLSGMTLSEARRLVTSCLLDDGALDAADLPKAMDAKMEELEESSVLELIGFDRESAPLGGLWRLKEWLHRFRAGFSERARELGLRPPRGVLLVGVQGCGKSLAAKEIARDWGVPLARLDPSRLFDKYIGESERNLRNALETAEALAPIVLWIDEIEKVFASGGSSEADAGLGRRLFGSFLTWMQERKGAVFVVATANDLTSIPPELLRKGRFDEVFFIDLPDEAARREIFTIHLRLRQQKPESFDLETLAREAEGFSGAEIEQAVVSALYGMVAEGGLALTDDRLRAELQRTVPLVRSCREETDALRRTARERFVPAD
jgi:ATPase family protein associated with various cellular activities (AAA)/AAA+ lid domain-containing protein